MYTLLISDDEFYTRKGILNELPLKSLKIDTIIEAEDGLDALEKTEGIKVDIVLTDVRMPRKNGIEMAFELRKRYPDCIIIFMSGFSDKEYLRSAIKLQAIHYVDKPIDTEELITTLKEAVQICEDRTTSAKIILAAQKNEITHSLMYKQSQHSKEQLKVVGLYEKRYTPCLTIILRYLSEQDEDLKSINLIQQFIQNQVDTILKKHNLFYICAFKDSNNMIIHLFHKKFHFLTSVNLLLLPILNELSENMVSYPHFISVGNVEPSLYQLYNSYNTAVLSLQDNFYSGANSISVYENAQKPAYEFDEKLVDIFEEYIIKKDFDNAAMCIKELTNTFSRHQGTLISNVKNAYFFLILRLSQVANMKYVSFFTNQGSDQFAWEYIVHTNTLKELERFLLECLNMYIDESNHISKSNNLISSMVDFIDENISNPDLSLDLISSNMQLSSSYLSLVFKEKTEETINQYITECRIKMAKKLLLDLRLKISDVGLKSGYIDNNYFSKVFKKHVGVSPSEYREGN